MIFLNYSIYKNARNAAWQCLIDCDVKALPVPVGHVVRHYGLKIIHNNEINLLRDGESGRIVIHDGKAVIVVRENEPKQRLRFTAMHELGHYLLGHLGENGEMSRDDVRSEDEQSADAFAARVLMPAVVLWKLGLQSADEIAVECNVSRSSAEIRAERLAVLRERGKFLSHDLERQIYQQFHDFIVENSKH